MAKHGTFRQAADDNIPYILKSNPHIFTVAES
jgi:hypothetical protein